MDRQQIIMNFTVPPSSEDLEVIAADCLENLPDELLEFCDGLTIQVEDIPDETLETELDIQDPFDLLAYYKSGKQISPGVESKVANDDDFLILFRRPILDLWCENQEELASVVRQVMVEELGSHFEFSDDEIDDMNSRHFQGMF